MDASEQLSEILARQDRLEARLAKIEATLYGPPPPRPAALPPLQIEEPQPLEQSIPIPIHHPEVEPEPVLESKLGLNLLNRIGVVTLLLGVAFFFKWSIDNNWIGPTGRVLLGLLAGFIALGIADLLWRKRQQIFAQGITGAGVAILYISLYAAFDFYHLISQLFAFVLMLAATTLTAALALRYDAAIIAALGFVGAYLIPLLLSNGEDRPWFLLFYLLVINAAGDLLAALRSWRFLEVLTFAATGMLFAGSALESKNHLASTIGVFALCAQRYRTSWPILFVIAQAATAVSLASLWLGSPNFIWLALLAALGGLVFAQARSFETAAPSALAAFWLTAYMWSWEWPSTLRFMLLYTAGFALFFAYAWWRRSEPATPFNLAAFATNGLAFFALTYSVLQTNHQQSLGLIATAISALYLASGFVLHRKQTNQELATLSFGLSIVFLSLATPIQFSGFSIVIAWSIQAALLTWIAKRFANSNALYAATAVFSLALTYTLLKAPDLPLLPLVVLGLALLLAAYWSAALQQLLARLFYLAGHFTLLTGLTLQVIRWAGRNSAPANLRSTETISVTILFALYSVMLVTIGVMARSAISRLSGLALTGIVILKLYLFDVWQLGRLYQIIAFVVLGILLLATSFLYSRFKDVIAKWGEDN